MFGWIQDWIRKHWKTSMFLLVGYWLTYAVLATATGQPILLPTITVTMAKTLGV